MLKKHLKISDIGHQRSPQRIFRQILGWVHWPLDSCCSRAQWGPHESSPSYLDLEHCRNEVSLRKAPLAASEGMETINNGVGEAARNLHIYDDLLLKADFTLAWTFIWFRLHPITSSMYNIYCQLPHLSKVTRGTCIQSNCPFAIHDLNQNSIWKWVKTLMPCSSHVQNRQNGPGVNTTILVGCWV